MPIKDYFSAEVDRNHKNSGLYVRILKIAFGDQDDEMIGHHLSFQEHGKIDTLNEIPSADTMIFDHDIMGRVFGRYAPKIMAALALVPVDGGQRDSLLQSYLNSRESAASYLAHSAVGAV